MLYKCRVWWIIRYYIVKILVICLQGHWDVFLLPLSVHTCDGAAWCWAETSSVNSAHPPKRNSATLSELQYDTTEYGFTRHYKCQSSQSDKRIKHRYLVFFKTVVKERHSKFKETFEKKPAILQIKHRSQFGQGWFFFSPKMLHLFICSSHL